MMKTLHKLLKFAAFVICCICVVTVKAQEGFVGDGFGGRSWYKPSNMMAGKLVSGAIVKGQLYLWGTSAYNPQDDPFINPFTKVNDEGQPVGGSGSNSWSVVKPYAVAGWENTKIVSIQTAASGIKADGSGWVWGPDFLSQMPSTTDQNFWGRTPIQVFPAGQAYHTSAGYSHAAFVKTDGTVWSVGWNVNGCFGNGTASNSNYTTTPVQMTGITNAKRVVCDDATFFANTTPATLVLKGDGTVWVAGAAGYLQSGGTDYLPHQVPGLTNVVDIKGGEDFAVALKSNGEVYCWGISRSTLGNGELYSAAGTPKIYYTPQKVLFPAGTPPIVAIETCGESVFTYAIDEAGTLWGWGYQRNVGMFGNQLNTNAELPVICTDHVADVTAGGGNRIAYLTRNSEYPASQRLWFISATTDPTYKVEVLAPKYVLPVTVSVPDTGYLKFIVTRAWMPSDPTSAGLPSGIGTFDGDGTINCNKTQLTPAPVQGTASNLNLAVSINVTTTGNFTPVISGSGMSLANPTYTISATTTGTQVFYIPLRYDGSALSTINLKIKEIATGCTITITGSKPAIVNIITNDCVPTAGPALK